MIWGRRMPTVLFSRSDIGVARDFENVSYCGHLHVLCALIVVSYYAMNIEMASMLA